MPLFEVSINGLFQLITLIFMIVGLATIAFVIFVETENSKKLKKVVAWIVVIGLAILWGICIGLIEIVGV